MALQRIGTPTAVEATTVTIPVGHQAGDIIFIFAFNSGAATNPSLPAGWTSLGTNNNNSVGGRIGYKIAQSASETSGTWTNATQLVCAVYRNQSTNKNPIATLSANAAGNANLNTTVLYQALVPMQCGTSWVIAFAAIKSIDTALETPPTGLVNKLTSVGATVELAMHDSNGILQSFRTSGGGNLSVSIGGTAGAWQTWRVELMAEEMNIENYKSVKGGDGLSFGERIR